ncbi:hypothetical protein B0H13DRAFT_892216 [Mycena leptocephala]|nr:hypothetical protein B0H13DRAFT_892216 [Mycena leptocephala]
MLVDLEADRALLSDLDAQILDFERSLSALRIEKARVKERLDSYKYPVLTLPSEIVSEIFVHFLPTYPLCSPLTGILSPTLLTHICRTWQEIALGTPALWRVISSSYNGIPFERQVHITSLWLKRSGSCPLAIRIDDSRSIMYGALASVIPHRRRWEYLKLRLTSYLPTINGPMPLLRHLDFRLGHYSPSAITFSELPLLRTVILNGAAAGSVVLPWAQLTSLTLNRIYMDECVPILQQTSSLVRCALYFALDDPTDQSETEPDIRLPCLESLTLVAEFDADLVPDCLKTFIVPALRSLEISERFIGPNPIESLTSFIDKSGCKLQEIYITGESVTRALYREAFPSTLKFFFEDEYD